MSESNVIATLNPVAGIQLVVTWHKSLADFGIMDFGLEAAGYIVVERHGEHHEIVRYKSTRLHRTLNRAIKLHLQLHESSLIVAKDAAAGVFQAIRRTETQWLKEIRKAADKT